ncbi:nucleoside triphosphate pyrophosphohydrolase [Candidatus Nomurabacteria bacterium]|nr:nucleoside triphosphate pyrophosphohydrolase [Candidatus Nomurabacteria bacterium]
MKRVYYKLIRDGIPKFLDSIDADYEIFEADGEEYLWFLKRKLVEEGEEVFRAVGRDEVVSELADVVEVLRNLRKEYGISAEELRGAVDKKARKRGRFEKRLVLKWSEDKKL